MIIITDNEVQIGDRKVANIFGPDGKWHIGVPCVIMRKATKEEYINQCKEHNLKAGRISIYDRYYDISVD